VCIGAIAEIALMYAEGDVFLDELIGLPLLAAIAFITVPFATTTEWNGEDHLGVAIVFVIAAYVYLPSILFSHVVKDERLGWAVAFVWWGSSLLLMFVLGPLATLLYINWGRSKDSRPL
jgi:heme/copper-type cytochrome/quinol oxidase subunit 4